MHILRRWSLRDRPYFRAAARARTAFRAFAFARLAVRTDSVLCGISSGAALAAAAKLAARGEFKGKNVAVLLPDGGEKYLSTPGFVREGTNALPLSGKN